MRFIILLFFSLICGAAQSSLTKEQFDEIIISKKFIKHPNALWNSMLRYQTKVQKLKTIREAKNLKKCKITVLFDFFGLKEINDIDQYNTFYEALRNANTKASNYLYIASNDKRRPQKKLDLIQDLQYLKGNVAEDSLQELNDLLHKKDKIIEKLSSNGLNTTYTPLSKKIKIKPLHKLKNLKDVQDAIIVVPVELNIALKNKIC